MVAGFLKKLALSASLGLAGCGSGADGIKIKGDYPELTAEIKQNLERSVLEMVENKYRIVEDPGSYDGSAAAFDGTTKELINYFIDFTQEDYKAEGASMPGLEGVTLSLLPKEKVKEICGEEALACYDQSSEIIMPDTLDILAFFSIFNHEFGHRLYSGNKEYPSVANDIYSKIKSYNFSLKIGSLLANNMFFGYKTASMDSLSPHHNLYQRANLFSKVNLMDNNSSIENAMYYLANTRNLAVETRLDEKLSEYEGLNPAEIDFRLWNELIDSYDFMISLIRKDDLHYTSSVDSYEFVQYARINNYAMSLFTDTENVDKSKEYVSLLESFAENGSFDNPHFRASVAYNLTRMLYSDMSFLYIQNHDGAYDLAKRIISINARYPCAAVDAYECPRFIREIRNDHVRGYYMQSILSADSNGQRSYESEHYAIDFLTKFYPGINFPEGDFSALESALRPETNNYVPGIAFNAGHNAMQHDYCLAEKFFDAALAVQCMEDALGPIKYGCMNMQEYAQYYLDYLDEIDMCKE